MELRKKEQLIPVLPENTSSFCPGRQRTLAFEVHTMQATGIVVTMHKVKW